MILSAVAVHKVAVHMAVRKVAPVLRAVVHMVVGVLRVAAHMVVVVVG